MCGDIVVNPLSAGAVYGFFYDAPRRAKNIWPRVVARVARVSVDHHGVREVEVVLS